MSFLRVARAAGASGDKHASLAPDVLKKTLFHFKNLTSLDLGGKKATAAVFTLAAKQPWASTLESFTYRECGATPFDTVGLLGQATHLTSLSMTCDADVLRQLSNAWRKNRGGDAAPLLASLDLSGGWSGRIGWPALEALPSQFPELEKLKITMWLSNAQPFRQLAQPFARLLELSITRLIASYSGGHLTSEKLGSFLRTIFAATPVVETLCIHHGSMYVSGRERKEGKRMDPFPGVDGALAELPTSLVELTLASMSGPEGALALAAALCADRERFPRLTPANASVTKTGGVSSYGYAQTVTFCLDPKVEAKKAADKAKADKGGKAGTSSSRPESSLHGSLAGSDDAMSEDDDVE
ncbi:hypothetical protein EMIHUDRAFT_204384 [Emiliania huxleyi CCMP1516]|uniref:Uncharacterized protein n=2 Tax=Emiliania huxleyi TaxID=2903 RepID=A0A0D3JYB2_EMIH1|nr:hypothetical protein EMIHUDRAFT_204384 [Emiliania huxleyi CCMP1516]EOD28497.1 hypothetical protein EMIHUDRAFT_204384 [Emiliania huxleyi CCMP1516]|eukprot:XP_005780926.1 hypothetical protein EMIHUDRAFT_204384 [Emiliania huxleyi CCMP1516]